MSIRCILSAVLLVLALPIAAQAEAMRWSNINARSSMSYDNGAGSQRVTAFTTDIAFDPRDLEGSHVSFKADLITAFMPPDFLDADMRALMSEAPNGGQIDDKSIAIATFSSTAITRQDATHFTATGTLSIDGKSSDMEAPFSVEVVQGSETPMMIMSGSFSIHSGSFTGGALPSTSVAQLPFMFEFYQSPEGE